MDKTWKTGQPMKFEPENIKVTCKRICRDGIIVNINA